MDFASRWAQPEVIKCVGFDDASDFNTGNGGTGGAYGQNFGLFPPLDQAPTKGPDGQRLKGPAKTQAKKAAIAARALADLDRWIAGEALVAAE